ncbi:alpha amylase family protein [Bacillus tianshenii]|nr:alpha amylase family protein [Bacillus tianshenii]
MFRHAKVLWIDFLANAPILINAQKREEYITNAKKAGFTHIVVDAKIPYGYVTGKSEYAPHVGEWERFKDWKGMDYVAIMLEVIRRHDLMAILKLDVFGEGKVGEFLSRNVKPDWLVTYQQNGLENTSISSRYTEHAIFVNPENREVRDYELAILRESMKNYEVDAVVLDRCRYPKGGPAPHCVNWIKERAQTIKDFVMEAKAVVKAGHSKGQPGFGVYVGSWYPEFYLEGVNWASREFEAGYEWMVSGYAETGYAEELDFLMTGCYYPDVTIEKAVHRGLAEWKSVEGAIRLSKEVTTGKVPILPSLFLKDYENEETDFLSALKMCRRNGNGMMLFDAIYLETYNWWNILIEETGEKHEESHLPSIGRETLQP